MGDVAGQYGPDLSRRLVARKFISPAAPSGDFTFPHEARLYALLLQRAVFYLNTPDAADAALADLIAVPPHAREAFFRGLVDDTKPRLPDFARALTRNGKGSTIDDVTGQTFLACPVPVEVFVELHSRLYGDAFGAESHSRFRLRLRKKSALYGLDVAERSELASWMSKTPPALDEMKDLVDFTSRHLVEIGSAGAEKTKSPLFTAIAVANFPKVGAILDKKDEVLCQRVVCAVGGHSLLHMVAAAAATWEDVSPDPAPRAHTMGRLFCIFFPKGRCLPPHDYFPQLLKAFSSSTGEILFATSDNLEVTRELLCKPDAFGFTPLSLLFVNGIKLDKGLVSYTPTLSPQLSHVHPPSKPYGHPDYTCEWSSRGRTVSDIGSTLSLLLSSKFAGVNPGGYERTFLIPYFIDALLSGSFATSQRMAVVKSLLLPVASRLQRTTRMTISGLAINSLPHPFDLATAYDEVYSTGASPEVTKLLTNYRPGTPRQISEEGGNPLSQFWRNIVQPLTNSFLALRAVSFVAAHCDEGVAEEIGSAFDQPLAKALQYEVSLLSCGVVPSSVLNPSNKSYPLEPATNGQFPSPATIFRSIRSPCPFVENELLYALEPNVVASLSREVASLLDSRGRAPEGVTIADIVRRAGLAALLKRGTAALRSQLFARARYLVITDWKSALHGHFDSSSTGAAHAAATQFSEAFLRSSPQWSASDSHVSLDFLRRWKIAKIVAISTLVSFCDSRALLAEILESPATPTTATIDALKLLDAVVLAAPLGLRSIDVIPAALSFVTIVKSKANPYGRSWNPNSPFELELRWMKALSPTFDGSPEAAAALLSAHSVDVHEYARKLWGDEVASFVASKAASGARYDEDLPSNADVFAPSALEHVFLRARRVLIGDATYVPAAASAFANTVVESAFNALPKAPTTKDLRKAVTELVPLTLFPALMPNGAAIVATVFVRIFMRCLVDFALTDSSSPHIKGLCASVLGAAAVVSAVEGGGAASGGSESVDVKFAALLDKLESFTQPSATSSAAMLSLRSYFSPSAPSHWGSFGHIARVTAPFIMQNISALADVSLLLLRTPRYLPLL